jgi:hypothetical protein
LDAIAATSCPRGDTVQANAFPVSA